MSNFLTLGRPSGDVTYNNLGFYRYNPKNNILPSYVAWIAMSDVPQSARLTLNFDDEETTDISRSVVSPSAHAEQRVFTLQGQRIDPSAMQKGQLYIVNGRKVLQP
jgi:hypothetical protein